MLKRFQLFKNLPFATWNFPISPKIETPSASKTWSDERCLLILNYFGAESKRGKKKIEEKEKRPLNRFISVTSQVYVWENSPKFYFTQW